jgi:hypothetical protein
MTSNNDPGTEKTPRQPAFSFFLYKQRLLVPIFEIYIKETKTRAIG